MNSLRNHERLCPENPDRQYLSHSIGRAPWNKGKKKDQDSRIAAQAAHLKARYDSGDLKSHWEGKHLLDSAKKKLSEAMKKAHREGRAHNIGECRWNKEHSYPEKWWIKVLENEFNLREDIDYQTEYHYYRFNLDIAFPEEKICIEIDGEQHYTDKAQIIRDKNKDYLLKLDGWKELRIRWLDCYHDPKKYIAKVKKLLKNVLLGRQAGNPPHR